VVSEILLEARVKRHVSLVVTEQVELWLVCAPPGQVEIIERVSVGRNSCRIGDAVRVLPNGRLGLEESAEGVAVRLRWVLPIGPDRVPAVAQPFLVGVAVLGDDGGYAFWMF